MAVLDGDGKVKRYQTKVERIAELEEAMERIAALAGDILPIEGSVALDEIKAIVERVRRTDARWKKSSPRRYEIVKAVEALKSGQVDSWAITVDLDSIEDKRLRCCLSEGEPYSDPRIEDGRAFLVIEGRRLGLLDRRVEYKLVAPA